MMTIIASLRQFRLSKPIFIPYPNKYRRVKAIPLGRVGRVEKVRKVKWILQTFLGSMD